MNKEEREGLFQKCLDVKLNATGGSKWMELNAACDYPFVDGERLRCWFKAEAKKRIEEGEMKREEVYPQEDGYLEPDRPYNESIEVNADGSQCSDKLIAINREDLKDPLKIMKLHGYDPSKWQVKKVSNTIWNSAVKGGGKTELYASKLWVEPRSEVSPEQVEDIFKRIAARKREIDKPYTNYSPNGKILEICLTDLHFGMLAWGEETGTDFDIKIATRKFRGILDDIISKTRFFSFKKIYFIFCHDFFHCNNQEKTTNKGTPVDTDGGMFKIFDRGLNLLVEALEKLREIAPVETVWLHSNHSADTSYYAVRCLAAYFRNDERVVVDTSPAPRKYRAFGQCLLGMAHGDNEGKRAATIMQVEVPKLYGEAKYRCLHLGHQHHEKVEDINGVVVRYLPSPAPADSWHTRLGFLGAQRKIQSFIWDENKGIEYIIQTMIDY